jgi:hypothetical protein
MKKRIRVLLFLVALSVILPVGINSALGEEEHWADQTVADLIDKAIVSQSEYLQQDYDTPITRGQFASVFVRLFDDDENVEYTGEYFTDIAVDDVYYSSTAKAKELGLILGYDDGAFRADLLIQRQELFAIVGRAVEKNIPALKSDTTAKIEFADASGIQPYAVDYINSLVACGIIVGYEDKTIQPENNITCAEALSIIARTDSIILEPSADKVPTPEKTPKPVISKTPTPIPSPTSTPTPSPTPTPIVTQNTNPGGGGGGSSNSNSNSNQNVADQPVLIGSTTSNVDGEQSVLTLIASLENVANVKIRFPNAGYYPDLFISENAEISYILDFLRNTAIKDGTDIILSGGSHNFIFTSQSGQTAQFGLVNDWAFANNKSYPMYWKDDTIHIDNLIGKLILTYYEKVGNTVLNGTVTEITNSDFQLHQDNGNVLTFETNGVTYFDTLGWGNSIQDGDRVKVVLSGTDKIEKIIIVK